MDLQNIQTLGDAETIGWLDFAVRLGFAIVLGALIGAERQWRQRMAGLRTNCLVATGAAQFVLISAMVQDEISPTRIAAQVVSGIGFLGAGVILRDGLNIRGLNTAATLWCSAAVGSLAGSGLLLGAVLGTAGVVGANLALRPLGRLIDRQPTEDVEIEHTYRFQVTSTAEQEAHVRALMLQAISNGQFRLQALQSRDLEGGNRVEVSADFTADERDDALLEQTASRLSLEPYVSAVSWEMVDETSPLASRIGTARSGEGVRQP
jgi:putative Mg2+ transporter-C (MgtC) family protein